METITFEDLCKIVVELSDRVDSAQSSADEALGYLDGFNGNQKVMIGIDQCLEFIEQNKNRINELEDEIESMRQDLQ